MSHATSSVPTTTGNLSESQTSTKRPLDLPSQSNLDHGTCVREHKMRKTSDPIRNRQMSPHIAALIARDSPASGSTNNDRNDTDTISSAIMRALYPQHLATKSDLSLTTTAPATATATSGSIYILPTPSEMQRYIDGKFSLADTRTIALQITRNILEDPVLLALMQGAQKYNRILYDTKNGRARIMLAVIDATDNADIQLDIDHLKKTLSTGFACANHKFTVTVGSFSHSVYSGRDISLNAGTKGMRMCITASFDGY